MENKEELAIFGGKPVRENKIFYGRQYIDQADVDAVAAVMTSDYITCGPKVKELEQHLFELTHAKYAVVVCNGTAALHLAALAAGFGEGDEVIVSSITFAASSNCVLYAGAKPVFADIDPETYNIDPASIRKLITPRTKAIVAVDFTGQAVELDEIRDICKEHDLILIEYAAHAIDRSVGSGFVPCSRRGLLLRFVCVWRYDSLSVPCRSASFVRGNDGIRVVPAVVYDRIIVI